jgi:parallel beta-helix repeat protein
MERSEQVFHKTLTGQLMRKFSLLLVASVTVAVLILGTTAVTRASSSICVNPNNKICYATIQAAVNAASNGSQISVASGTYHEQVTIKGKYVTLNGSNAVVDAKGQLHGIYVDGSQAAGTVISGFTVQNALLEGILLQDTSRVTVKNNLIENNDLDFIPPSKPSGMGTCPKNPFPGLQGDCGEGFHLMGTSNSQIIGNTSEHNVGGLLLSDETGPTFNNLIEYNNVSNNTTDCGITLASHNPASGFGVYKNVIYQNVTNKNGSSGIGIFAPMPGTATYDNLVSHNTAKNNGLGGIDLHSHTSRQNLNGNAIIGNTISGNARDIDTGETVPVGIVVFANLTGHAAPITNTTITYNTVTDESIDVYMGTAETELTLRLNNLLGGSKVMGVDNVGSSGTADATANYWGCSQGPGKSNCTTVGGSVTFTPWLTRTVS